MNISHRTHRAEKIAISKAQAAAHAATELGKAPDKYAHRTEWQDRMLAAMMDDAKKIKARNNPPQTKMSGNDGEQTGAASIIRNVLKKDGLNSIADLAKKTGCTKGTVRLLINRDYKAGRVEKKRIQNVWYWMNKT